MPTSQIEPSLKAIKMPPMFDDDPELAPAREELFRGLRRRRIASDRVLEAMKGVGREAFVADELRHLAYKDNALPTAHGQTISQPAIVAIMTTALAIEPDNVVMEIGTGSGYQAAVISRLARRCLTIELYPELARRAADTFCKLGIDNVEVVVGDGSMGLAERGPYDRILVTAAAPSVPEALLTQLRQAPGSRLVAPVGDQHLQTLQVVEWKPDGWQTWEAGPVRFVPLRGAAGWADSDWLEPGQPGAAR